MKQPGVANVALETQAELLHDAARSHVRRQGKCDDAGQAKPVDAQAQQSSRHLGRQPFPPERRNHGIGELDLVLPADLDMAKTAAADEGAAGAVAKDEEAEAMLRPVIEIAAQED